MPAITEFNTLEIANMNLVAKLEAFNALSHAIAQMIRKGETEGEDAPLLAARRKAHWEMSLSLQTDIQHVTADIALAK